MDELKKAVNKAIEDLNKEINELKNEVFNNINDNKKMNEILFDIENKKGQIQAYYEVNFCINHNNKNS